MPQMTFPNVQCTSWSLKKVLKQCYHNESTFDVAKMFGSIKVLVEQQNIREKFPTSNDFALFFTLVLRYIKRWLHSVNNFHKLLRRLCKSVKYARTFCRSCTKTFGPRGFCHFWKGSKSSLKILSGWLPHSLTQAYASSFTFGTCNLLPHLMWKLSFQS